jgi:hypothetical protein
MCLRRAPEKYIAGAALYRAALDSKPIKYRRVLVSSRQENRDYVRGDPPRWSREIFLSAKVGTNFADNRRLLGLYISLSD